MKRIALILIGLVLFFGCIETGYAPNSGANNPQTSDLNLNNGSDWYPSTVKQGISSDSNLKDIAIKSKDFLVCEEIVSQNIRNSCLLNIAISLKDKLICDMIDVISVKTDCLDAVQRRVS